MNLSDFYFQSFKYVNFERDTVLYSDKPILSKYQIETQPADADYFSIKSFNNNDKMETIADAALSYRASGNTVAYLTDADLLYCNCLICFHSLIIQYLSRQSLPAFPASRSQHFMRFVTVLPQGA